MATLPNTHLNLSGHSADVLPKGRQDDRVGGTNGGADSAQVDPPDSADPQGKNTYYREILAQSGSAELRQVDVDVQDGRIVLCGRVSSFYQKQLAQESLLPVAIGMQICNRLEVDR
ncbi:hypothetical protein Mal15_28750 [Stieleria maiorica]|uniref:BON domain protein n=1 Tax=Stieleria maiorica TaxID=2795974 RepID=A0A5B9MCQ7_9BACT|nr:BON domain-containing protein [Stieleria maiorica]QEF98818.1 hypothetical protein Mal15_28750 [Stieleria maiorica]